MSSSAVLRSACRALRRSSSFPRALFAKEQRFLPRSPMPTRRLYRSDDCVRKAELSKYSQLDTQAKLQNSGHETSIVPRKKTKVPLTLDQVYRIFDEREIMLKQLEVAIIEKIKRDRRRRVLLGASIFSGLAIYVKQRFFGGSQEVEGSN
ncbi:uncharacterized protein LOC133887499 [Phragmites australis]|uniref:uncharacterized protein LOC133887499 n=1 Tax=Phragmites australis TaxID=29695 RepID=UPI002D782544|nr:uncharacterized protein LOC133887499 [Phragmites australis]